jgi:hypothetical protein
MPGDDADDSAGVHVAGGWLVIVGVGAVVLLIVSIAGCIALLSRSPVIDGDDPIPLPRGGPEACVEFRRVVNDVAFGVIGGEELAEEVRLIWEYGSTAELSIRVNSNTMLRRALVGDPGAFAFSVQEMGIACEEHGY